MSTRSRYYRTPLYPFGHGLSLTSWILEGDAPACLARLSTAVPLAPCQVQLSLRNTGALAGDSVVMAYFQLPGSHPAMQPQPARNGGASLLAPLKQLFGFQRLTSIVAHGDGTTMVTFDVSPDDLAVPDLKSGDLTVEPGIYELRFEDGTGQVVMMPAVVSGPPVVLEKFPSMN